MKILKQTFPFLVCFFLTLPLFSLTAFAAEVNDTVSFAELYGLELADGEKIKVSFEFSGFGYELSNVTNATTVKSVVSRLNGEVMFYGYTASFDAVSGQIVVTDDSGDKADFRMLVNGKELAGKPARSDLTMTELLVTIGSVFSAAVFWISAVSDTVIANPILLLCVVMGFIGTGVSLFRRLLKL